MQRMHQIVGILIRVAAIFVLLKALAFIVRQISWALTAESIEPIILILLAVFTIIPLIIAAIMWKFPLYIAYKIVPEVQKDSKISELPMDQIQVAALSVVGVFIVVSSLSDLLYWYAYFREIGADDFGNRIGAGGYAAIYKSIFEIVLGVWLMFGSRGIIGLIKAVRYAGTRK